MSAPAETISPDETRGGSPWPWAILALLVCLIAISSQSLWIDEAFMASKASQPTFAAWWHEMRNGSGSDLQMPLYMLYVWAFAKIFSVSEWALRAANIPWFVAGVAAFIPAFPKSRRFAVAAVTLLCPFAWFYLDEARPYAMQLSSGLVIFAAIYRLSREPAQAPRRERNWIAAFWLGIIILCGSSLLGVIWAGAAFLSLFVLFPQKRLFQLLRAHWLACLLSAVVLTALAGYYVWTIKSAHGFESDKSGAGAAFTTIKSAARFRQGFSGANELQSIAYLIYDLAGFSGLGPGKLDIRTAGTSAFRPYVPQLTLYAVVLAAVVLLAALRIARGPGSAKKIFLSLIIFLPMALLLVAGYLLGFLVLGRHCAPVMAAWFFFLSLGIASACSGQRVLPKLLAGAFIALSLFSCLSLRFATRHVRDDYRDAARAANAALNRGQTVWWSASDNGAAYYHVPLADESGKKGRALLVLNPAPQTLAPLPPPDLIVASKPDIYDNQHALEKYVRNNPYTKINEFPAFAVWRRNSAPGAP